MGEREGRRFFAFRTFWLILWLRALLFALLDISDIARHNFAKSAEESEALHEISERMRMQLLAQGRRKARRHPLRDLSG